MTYCLPKYNFHILDDTGWNFRHAIYHEEHRRTLIKAYGMKFLINVNGNAGKFDVTKTITIVVTGLGLMGLANILCDFVLLKSSNKYRETIAEKKFEQIDTNLGDEEVMQGLKNLLQRRNTTSHGIVKKGALGVPAGALFAMGTSFGSPTPNDTTTENTPVLTRNITSTSNTTTTENTPVRNQHRHTVIY